MDDKGLLGLLERSKAFYEFTRNLSLEVENLRALHRMNMREKADAKRIELILMFESYLDTLVELDKAVREIK